MEFFRAQTDFFVFVIEQQNVVAIKEITLYDSLDFLWGLDQILLVESEQKFTVCAVDWNHKFKIRFATTIIENTKSGVEILLKIKD